MILIVGYPTEDKVVSRWASSPPGALYFMLDLLAWGERLCVLRKEHSAAAGDTGDLVMAGSP